jgi:hypothetical protein
MTELSRKTFEQLVEEKAGCIEFSLYGYIRIYEDGEKSCQCKDCKSMDILKEITEKNRIETLERMVVIKGLTGR